MKGSKKKFIGIFGLVCAAILALSIYLNAKAKDSRALAQYIPSSAYLVRINTQKALRLAYALRKDSFAQQQASSKWAALFNDTTKTGIDFLVDPWVFGDSSNVHVALQLRSVSNFVQWMKEVADTTFFIQKIQVFYAKESRTTFFTNGSKVAMLSLAPLPIALKTGAAFYSQKNRPAKRLENEDGLARLWLNKPLKMGPLHYPQRFLFNLKCNRKYPYHKSSKCSGYAQRIFPRLSLESRKMEPNEKKPGS